MLIVITKRTAEVRRTAMDFIRDKRRDVATALSKRYGFTRQTANWHLAALVTEGAVEASGNTRARTYRLLAEDRLNKVYQRAGLQEDEVWRTDVKPLLTHLPDNVVNLCAYGLQEMINNAVDHSASDGVSVKVLVGPGIIELRIADFGVGIFEKIQEHYSLPDARAVVLELTKGKVTTDPRHHTGEGIFFTSRMFDRFIIMSGTLFWSCRYQQRDWVLDDTAAIKGTYISMEISPWASRTAQSVTSRYSGGEADDYAFSKTEVPVFVAQLGGDESLVSRSAARRLLARLENWQNVLLDFTGIRTIGPAFADEIFRVFPLDHPEITIRPVNQSAAVSRMIHRAQRAYEGHKELEAAALAAAQ